MKKANPIAKSLRTPKYRPQIIPGKRPQETGHDYKPKNWDITLEEWSYVQSASPHEARELARQEMNAR